MKHIKKYNQFNEDFNWEEYGDKRAFVETLEECIKEVGELKDDIKKTYWSGRNKLSGAYIGEQMIKNGFDRESALSVISKVSFLEGRIGPNMAGEFRSKQSFFQKLTGGSSLTVGGDTSIIGRLMVLVDEDVKKELKDQHWKKVASEIWDIHPNNPKNKKNETMGYDDDGNFIGFNDPEYREEMRETDFANIMGEYIKEVESLKEKIIKIKESVLNKLSSSNYQLDSDKLNHVSDGFDEMLDRIGPDKEGVTKKRFIDRFKKEKEKTTNDYSILTLGDKFIKKEKVKYGR
jgi:hypothetical protein